MNKPWSTATVTATVAVLLVAAFGSLFIGVSDVSLGGLISGEDGELMVFVVSRVPRLLAIVLAGSSLAVAGLIMQHLARNRFVAPSTAGTVDAAALGVVVATIFVPSAPIMVKILASLCFALAASFMFIALIRRVMFKDVIFVPLLGLMFGAVLRAGAEFLAYRNNLLQTLSTWLNGDFSGILRGRYETLYLAAGIAVVAYLFANRLTVVGMGEDFSKNLGVSYQRYLNLGLSIVALVTAVVVVTVGAIPFLGLVVPNVVTLIFGDNLRRVLPLTAVGGAVLVLVGDMVGRLLIFPYEIPIGTILGVAGSALFLWMILKRRTHGFA